MGWTPGGWGCGMNCFTVGLPPRNQLWEFPGDPPGWGLSMGRALGGPGNAQAEPGLGFPRGQGVGCFHSYRVSSLWGPSIHSGDSGTRCWGGREGTETSLWGIPRESLNPSFQGLGDRGSGKGRWALPGLCVHLVGGWSEEGRYLPGVQNLRWC